MLPACKTDLSDVWNSIDNIDDRLSQVEKKIEEMNTNIDALSKICDALSSNVSVSSVTPLQDASGYEIVFSDGTKATIHNGTDAEFPRLASGASLGEPYVQDATYISVDGGKTWTRISGENGVSFFESVKADESSSKVTLVLADGTVIEVPFVKDFMFAFA
uniref:PL29 family lyase N-terminal domain-containing protein n=1 Tax=Candidatus Cryptobacteroides bacterium TaxID=3085639 RepID=UPI004028857C